MKHAIAMVFVSLTAFVLMASAQLPTTWTSPYYFYSNINTPPIVAPQKISADETEINSKTFTYYDDHSIQNTLSSHVVLLTACLRDLKTTKSDLAETHTTVEFVKKELKNTKDDLTNTRQRLDETHASVEGLQNELKGNSQLLATVMATFETLKNEMNNSAASSIGRMPKSCDDLHKIGHRKSGFFTVMGNKTVDNVYCDFTKPTTDAGFQKMIGYFDVKTSPIHFYAQRRTSYGAVNTAIPFEILKLNLGNAMSTSGIFVAPKSGKYSFALSGISEGNALARIQLQVKTATADWTKVGTAFAEVTLYQTFSLQSTLELVKGNQIRLLLLEGVLCDNDLLYTHFVGRLLEEDIEQ